MNCVTKRVFFEDYVFDVFEGVYEPAEDSFLLAQSLMVEKGDSVLDMGTGCGIQAILAAQKATRVVAVDVNPHAVRCTVHNAELNKVAHKLDVRQGRLFGPVKTDERFDLILFNAPYLPSETWEENDMTSRAWAGGESGRRVIDLFIDEVSEYLEGEGRVLLVQSTLSDVEKTLRRFSEKGLNAKVIVEKKVAFETIVIIEARFGVL